ncbi:MAG: Sec-independent protein translocase subunit TatA/TatB [Acidimicrobiales bacterium]
MPSSLGAPEILVILVVALIVLGPKRLPEAGRQIGKAMSEVRRWSQSVQSEIRDVIDVEPDPTPPPAPAPAPSSPTPASPAIDTTSSDEPPGEAPAPGAPSAT